MKIKIENAEIEINDELGKQIYSLIRDSVKEPYKVVAWEDIRNKKIDKSRIQVGTQIDVGCSSPFRFDVVDIKDNIYTLVSHYVIAELPFDAAEPRNPDETIRKYGSNDYLTSNIRQWLNIEIYDSGDFRAQTPYDIPFANWKNMRPFHYRIPNNNFLEEVLRNSDGDKFWLLSEEELENIQFFKKKENLKKTDENGEPKWWWLRTPYSSDANFVHGVHSDGSRYHSLAIYSGGVVPACQIKI